MKHFTCDLCSTHLEAGLALRYVVRIEGTVAAEPAELTDTDLDSDSIEMMAELMQNIESGECDDPLAVPPSHSRHEYDLCPACYKRFLADPLGLESRRKIQFSDN
ncbi:MAG: hypothetical protein ACRCZF_09995 [Gemmataceae bacterium]